MKFRLLLFSMSFLLSFGILSAQSGTITGSVVDNETKEPLIGASVLLLEEGKLVNGANSDFDGNYSIYNVKAGEYEIKVKFVMYDSLVVPVTIGNEEELKLDLRMVTETDTSNVVHIYGRVDKTTDTRLVVMQRMSTRVMDGISSQQIQRTGDNDAASAVSRVSSVSVEGGKYIYVRGLGDRYGKATLNGSEIPALDPNRNTVQMDMFPTQLLSNIVVNKTFTPDLPADFTGGLVSINTREFPDSLNIRYTGSLNFNNQSSFRSNLPFAESSATDFLGFDGGTRALPNELVHRIPDVTFSDAGEAARLDAASKSFDTPIYPTTTNTLFNTRHSLSIGNRFMIGNKPVGFLASLTYRNTNNFYDNGIQAQYRRLLSDTAGLQVDYRYNETMASKEAFLGALVNFSYRPNENNRVDLNFLRNQSGESTTRVLEGPNNIDVQGNIFQTRALSYLQRGMTNMQANAWHKLEKAKNMEISWATAFTISSQVEPDLRFFSNDYQVDLNGDTIYDIQEALYQKPARYYRDLDEQNYDAKLNFMIPFVQWNDRTAKLRFGGSFTGKHRTFRERRFDFKRGGDVNEYNNDPAAYFSNANLGITDTTMVGGNELYHWGNYVLDATEDRNQYNGDQAIGAGYLMTELPLSNKMEFIGGLRFERTDIFVENFDNKSHTVTANDLLPSSNLVIHPVERMNVRLGYNKTLARPTFREIAPFAAFNFVGGVIEFGNSDSLTRTLIDNFDVRWEFFPTNAELVSVSAFYKKFDNPIAKVFVGNNAPQATWINVGDANMMGVELEIKKRLGFISPKLENFRIGGNLSLIHSEVQRSEAELEIIRAFEPNASATRRMFGQSPYTINAELAYLNDSLGINTSINFNMFGERIAILGNDGKPDVYEQPRPRLDFSFGKRISDAITITLRGRNLINPLYQRVHHFAEQDFVVESYSVGRAFSMGLTWNIK